MTNLELTITKTLRELEIPAHVRGYAYIKTALELLIAEPELITSMATLYSTVAAEHATTWTRVERGIRHVRQLASQDKAVQKRILGRAIRMCNGEWLGALAEYLRMEGVA